MFTTKTKTSTYLYHCKDSPPLPISGLNDEKVIEIRIINLLGEEIYSEIMHGVEHISQTIELNHSTENGMYMLEITNGNKILEEKIIISK